MWGKRWRLPREKAGNRAAELPPRITRSEFWKGSAVGVAVGARSFPGIIAIHANADYILNFEKEIGVQRQIQELGRESETEFVALLDSNLNVVAHTDPGRIGQQEKEPIFLRAKGDRQLLRPNRREQRGQAVLGGSQTGCSGRIQSGFPKNRSCPGIDGDRMAQQLACHCHFRRGYRRRGHSGDGGDFP
jgi:hypothetical protein